MLHEFLSKLLLINRAVMARSSWSLLALPAKHVTWRVGPVTPYSDSPTSPDRATPGRYLLGSLGALVLMCWFESAKVGHRLRLLCQPVRRQWHALLASKSGQVIEFTGRIDQGVQSLPRSGLGRTDLGGLGWLRPLAPGQPLPWPAGCIKGWSIHSGSAISLRVLLSAKGAGWLRGYARGWSLV